MKFSRTKKIKTETVKVCILCDRDECILLCMDVLRNDHKGRSIQTRCFEISVWGTKSTKSFFASMIGARKMLTRKTS